MPKRNAHTRKAKHNRAFWQSHDITQTSYLDWVVIGMFYEAVHWVEAQLATVNEHSRNHHDRETKMSQSTVLKGVPDLVADYGTLSDRKRERSILRLQTQAL